MLLIFMVFIFVCTRFSSNPFIQKFIPLSCILLFTLVLAIEGFSIGIYSPATAAGLVGFVGIGLLIFSKPLVYSALMLAVIGLGAGTILSMNDSLTYAPLFIMQNIGTLHTNPFWLGSMSFFIIPLLLSYIVLFELILAQSRYREAVIQHNSQIDPLTHLYNHRKINEHLAELTTRTPLSAHAVILLDLDHFKLINDSEGHDMGDRVLVEVSRALEQSVRSTDIVGRFGGEEFIILLSDADQTLTHQIAERCRQTIENIELYNDHGKRICISASFGIRAIDAAESMQKILKHADDALYAAKAEGRNRIKFYDQTGHCAEKKALHSAV